MYGLIRPHTLKGVADTLAKGACNMGFLDDLGRKVSDAGQKTLQKTRDVSDIVRVNSLISEEERKVNNTYYQIGKLYVSMFGMNGKEEFAAMVQSVFESEEKIANYKKQVQDIKGVIRCAKCGAEVPRGVAFCSACGTPMTSNTVTDNMEDCVVCQNCGTAVKKNMRFCTCCGSPMNQPSNVVAPQPVQGRVCPNCGNALDEDSTFCTECGTRL
jgi:hypothetical protein